MQLFHRNVSFLYVCLFFTSLGYLFVHKFFQQSYFMLFHIILWQTMTSWTQCMSMLPHTAYHVVSLLFSQQTRSGGTICAVGHRTNSLTVQQRNVILVLLNIAVRPLQVAVVLKMEKSGTFLVLALIVLIMNGVSDYKQNNQGHTW